MPLLLHLETSAEFYSVCLSQGTNILASRTGTERFTHAANITRYVEACLQEAGRTINEISAISVSMGPGSYTGLRIGDTEAHILTETSFVEQLKNNAKVIFCGNAVEKAQTVITASHADFQLLMSNSTHLIAPALRKWHAKDFADVAYSTPFYFKNPNITTPKPNVLNKIMNGKNI